MYLGLKVYANAKCPYCGTGKSTDASSIKGEKLVQCERCNRGFVINWIIEIKTVVYTLIPATQPVIQEKGRKDG